MPHTVIVANAGGHLMQRGQVDVVIVGTYLMALAAHDNGVPFYVALPAFSIDWTIDDGLVEIPIEARSAEEVTGIQPASRQGRPPGPARSPACSSRPMAAAASTPPRRDPGAPGIGSDHRAG